MIRATRRGSLAALAALAFGCVGAPSGELGGGGLGAAVGTKPGEPTRGNGGVNEIGLEGMLEPIRARRGLTALAALVLKNGLVRIDGAVGIRKVGSDARVTVDDAWYLGANVEPMTSSIAARLVEAGVIAWTTTLAEAFPEATMHPLLAPVTLEQLLGHRGGIAALSDAAMTALRVPGDAAALRRNAVLAIVGAAPEATPGDYHPTNASYLAAAAMLEARSQTSWEELLRTQVFEPLGMRNCVLQAARDRSVIDVPWGHVTDGSAAPIAPVSPGETPEPPAAMGPTGALRCPLTAWAAFAAAQLAGARHEATPFLTAPSFAKLQVPAFGAFALGWASVSRPWAGSAPALNRGAVESYAFALSWLAPEKNVAFIVVANQGGGEAARAADEVVGELVSRYADE